MVHNQIAVAIITEEMAFDNPFLQKSCKLGHKNGGEGEWWYELRRVQQILHIGGCGVRPLAVGDDTQIHRFGDARPLHYRQLR